MEIGGLGRELCRCRSKSLSSQSIITRTLFVFTSSTACRCVVVVRPYCPIERCLADVIYAGLGYLHAEDPKATLQHGSGVVSIASQLNLYSAPKKAINGHQVGGMCLIATHPL
jgi:hypothetical protein